MKQKRLGKLAILICFALIASAFTAMPAFSKTKHKLIKEYTFKAYDSSNKSELPDGVKYYKTTFKYKKKDPKSQKKIQVFSNGKSSVLDYILYSFKYKKGVKKTMTERPDEYILRTFNYKKGIPVKYTEDNDGYITKENYKYKSRYAYYRHYEYYGSDESDTVKRTYKYKVSVKKGFPVKISYKDSDDNCYATFNKKGKAKGLIKQFLADRESYKYTTSYKYSFKKGLVSKLTIRTKILDKDENKTYSYRYVYGIKYSKNKIGTKRYCSMLNDIFKPDAFDLVKTYWY